MKTNHRGFTLLEIILVLFLITLILGLTAVSFSGFLPSVKFDAMGREISATIRHARSAARMSMETKTIVIDLDNKLYGMEGGTVRYLPTDLLIRIIDPFAGEITQGKYPIIFNPTGGIDAGTIILSRGKKLLQIRIDPIVGAVWIK
jgi:competence protein ComGD